MIFIHLRQQWLIDKYAGGGLSEKKKRALEKHFDQCKDCQKKLEEEHVFYKEMVDSGKLIDPAIERLSAKIMELPPHKGTLTVDVEEQQPQVMVPFYNRILQTLQPKFAIPIAVIILLNLVIWISKSGPHMSPIQVAQVLGTGIWYQAPGTSEWLKLDSKNPKFDIQPETKLKTDEYTKFQLKIGNIATVWIDHSAELTLLGDSNTAFDLAQGVAFVSVVHFHKPFHVETPAGMVEVFGTQFHLSVDSIKQTTVSCVEDTVYFHATAKEVAVPQGYQIQVTPNGVITPLILVDTYIFSSWQQQMVDFMQSQYGDRQKLRSEYITRANEAFHRKDYNSALEDYRTAASLDPVYYSSYYGVGRAYLAMGDYADATSAYLRAIILNPDYTVASYQLAESLIELKQYKQADNIIQKLITKQPEEHANYVLLGESYLKQGDTELAWKTYQKAIQYGADTCPYCIPRLHEGEAEISKHSKI